MGDYFDILTRARDLAPHGYCLLWQPELIWTHVIGDALIAAAYFSIPIAIVRFVTHRSDIEFSWIFWLFALFIVACGTTHLMAIWTLWNPDYGWEALIKIITAIASVGTAIELWPLIPKALAIPSPLQLREANAELSQRVRERDSALERLQREIHDRERAEAALIQAQKMDAVGQLTGGIAHDFNNLLAVVIGNLDMIGRKTDDDRTRRLAGNALQAAERGAKVTGQLLAFSRTQRLEVRPVLVSPLIDGLHDLLRQTIGPTVELNLDLAGDVAVLADPTQLELAILNLAINARDAMPEGGALTIATRLIPVGADPDLADGDYLELTVSDTGKGMAAEVAERAFDPFFTTKQVGQGTGLGLSMVYGVARQSGGVARIRSEPGKGATVAIILPRTDAVAAPVNVEQSDAADRKSSGLSILVVDDEPEVRTVLSDALVELGHHVTTASDGTEAVRLLESARFDLVMLDFAMPGMNGAQVAEAARRIRPEQKLVFVTGYADTGAIEGAARDAPILRKPFRSGDVARAVQAGLDAESS
jgi:signal transduction histidine kinase/ActR/RegA family two-component response regulator